MLAMGQPVKDQPTLDNYPAKLACKLILEEAMEFAIAAGMTPHKGDWNDLCASGDMHWTGMIDAICDILYVSMWAANAMGIDIDPFFKLVQDSNMSKLGPDGKPIVRESDGKILKPEGWKAPDISGLLNHVLTLWPRPKLAGSSLDAMLEPGRTWTHYKGGRYAIVVRATMEATGEDEVVYKSVKTGKVWIRPVTEFMSDVEVFMGGVCVLKPRFTPGF